MDSLPTPHLLVLNATTSEHHIPDDDPMQLTVEAIHLFLESIHQQKATVNLWHVDREIALLIFYVISYSFMSSNSFSTYN